MAIIKTNSAHLFNASTTVFGVKLVFNHVGEASVSSQNASVFKNDEVDTLLSELNMVFLEDGVSTLPTPTDSQSISSSEDEIVLAIKSMNVAAAKKMLIEVGFPAEEVNSFSKKNDIIEYYQKKMVSLSQESSSSEETPSSEEDSDQTDLGEDVNGIDAIANEDA